MIDLLPELSFGDNLPPSQVTATVRDELMSHERRNRNRLMATPFVVLIAVSFFLMTAVTAKGLAELPWPQIVVCEALGVAALLYPILWLYSRRTTFLRYADITTAVVIEVETTSLWFLGAGTSSASRSLPRNLSEALTGEDAGEYESVPHIVKVRLRFVTAGLPDEQAGWEALRDEVPHCDVTVRLRGGWGTFASQLKQGSLVSLLYWPSNPKRCQIVQRFKSHERLS